MYKLSPYIIESNDGEGGAWCFNALTGTLNHFDNSQYIKLKNIETNIVSIDDSFLNFLYEKKYLLDENIDLTNYANQLIQSARNSDDYLFVIIMPTFDCNFRCKYCYEIHDRKHMSSAMQESIIESIKKQLIHYKGLRIEWFGGEPLLALDMIVNMSDKLINLCREMNKPYVASITTNGYLLSYENYIKLKQSNITYYQVTIDGFPVFHDNLRPLRNNSPTYERIISNLITIKNRCKSSYIKICIRTNYTVEMQKMKNDWETFLKTTFFDDPRFIYMPKYVWDNPQSSVNKSSYVKKQYGSTVSLLDEYSLPPINKHSNKNLILVSELLKLKNNFICYASKKGELVIAPDGSLYKCTVHFDDDKNKIGYVDNDTKSFVFFEDKNNYWDPILEQKCIVCPMLPICLGGRGCVPRYQLNKNKYCHTVISDVIRRLRALDLNDNLKDAVNIERPLHNKFEGG